MDVAQPQYTENSYEMIFQAIEFNGYIREDGHVSLGYIVIPDSHWTSSSHSQYSKHTMHSTFLQNT